MNNNNSPPTPPPNAQNVRYSNYENNELLAPEPAPAPVPMPGPAPLTRSEQTHPEESIREILEQIAAIPIPPNQQNVGPLFDEIRLYQRIQAIIDYRLSALQESINAQQGGRKMRRRQRKTKRRYSR
jgi:hypothetical protein